MVLGQYLHPGLGVPLQNAGAATAGTNTVQTLTFSGTISGGTFKLALDGLVTGAITWSATNSTLVANIDAALEALPGIGASGVVTAVGTMTAGIGTITATFSGANTGKRPISLMTVSLNSLTGSGALVAVTLTTPGVVATGRNAPTGAQLIDTNTGDVYVNTSTTAQAPAFTKVGVQS